MSIEHELDKYMDTLAQDDKRNARIEELLTERLKDLDAIDKAWDEIISDGDLHSSFFELKSAVDAATPEAHARLVDYLWQKVVTKIRKDIDDGLDDDMFDYDGDDGE